MVIRSLVASSKIVTTKTRQDHRDVIFTTVICFRNQLVAGNGEVGFVALHDSLNLRHGAFRRAHRFAEQQHVTTTQTNAARCGSHLTGHRGLQDHVAEHVRLGFCFTDLTDINQLLPRDLMPVARRIIPCGYDRRGCRLLDQIRIVVLDGGSGKVAPIPGSVRLLAAMVNSQIRIDRRTF